MPKLLSDEEICEACPASGMRTDDQDNLRCSPEECLVHPDFKTVAQAQLNKDIAYYESMIIPERIKQAKRELVEKIENYDCANCKLDSNDCVMFYKSCPWWQQLKKEEGIE